MAVIVPIEAIPNQSLDFNAEQQVYKLRLHVVNTNIAIDIARNGTQLQSSRVCPAGALLIEYDYLRGSGGDFGIITQNDEIPVYTQFGVTQFLVYYFSDELS